MSPRPPRGAARRRPPRPPASGPPAGAGEGGEERGSALAALGAWAAARSGCGARSVPPGAAAGCPGRSGRRGAGPGLRPGVEQSPHPSAGPAHGSPGVLRPLPPQRRSDAGLLRERRRLQPAGVLGESARVASAERGISE